MNFDPIPDAFPPVRPSTDPPIEPTELEREEDVLATEGETTLTTALAALKRKGERTVQTVEAAIGPTRMVLGATLAVGLGALFVLAVVRARRPRRRPTLARAVGRSIARELAARVALGAAAALGARLAETVLVPMLVASISAATVKRARAPRARKAKAVVLR